MTPEECFATWAPDGVVWAQWAKPVIFAQFGAISELRPVAVPAFPSTGLPESASASAIVVDLPGAESVRTGLGLADRGFRPVPLYNGTSGPAEIVDTTALVEALVAGTWALRGMVLRPDAKPAFLLDANRNQTLQILGTETPGRYDNRWVVLPQDLPSATFILSHGIRDVTLIQRHGLEPAPDLAHVLRRWQEAGLTMRAIDLAKGLIAENVTIPVPSLFRRLWYGAVVLAGLRRNNVGGFGSMIPEATAHSGYYG